MDTKETKIVADFLVADFANEMPATLRVIQAVPNSHLDYQPDSKSKTHLGASFGTSLLKTNGC